MVVRIRLDAVVRRLLPEAHDHGPRLVLLHAPQRLVDRAEQRVDRPPLRALDLVGHGVEAAVEQPGGVAQQERRSHGGKYGARPCGRSPDSTELKQAEGETLGSSDWHEVTQKDVDTFADVTGDHQWIHVDVERAKETPFGGTIAHGYLTLSLGPHLNNQVFKLDGFAFALNYGLNKVRFPAPVPIPSKVRASPKVKEVQDIPGGAQVVFEVSFEREGTEKPVCVAETVVRVYEG